MAELLKNVFNTPYFERMAAALKAILPSFNKRSFIQHTITPDWEQKELKQRMRHTTTVLNQFLPGNFPQQCHLLVSTLKQMRDAHKHPASLADLVFPDFIEMYGTGHPDVSLDAMETVTQYISCEFAIRPFLKNDLKGVMKRMLKWSLHPDEKVRRFSSEGCRPRLPWAMAIPDLKKDPSPVLAVLENLKADPAEWVRRSVANNLNDIAKDHPDKVKNILQEWKGISKETDWILKHGCRTLLKKADPDALSFFGWGGKVKCKVSAPVLSHKKLRIGDELTFSFDVISAEKKKVPLRLEYAVYYVKANGTQSRKIFQLAQNNADPGVSYTYKRKISFRDLTTRKHYSGSHRLAIIINGNELETAEFILQK